MRLVVVVLLLLLVGLLLQQVAFPALNPPPVSAVRPLSSHVPHGAAAGIVPTTNPTSTAIFKALLCLKTRNALVLCPHPRAAKYVGFLGAPLCACGWPTQLHLVSNCQLQTAAH